MEENKKSLYGSLAVIWAAFLWGTIGIFRRFIVLPSGMLAFARGVIGALVLLLLYPICRQKPDFAAIRRNVIKLLLSGIFLGLNWICLFEAYRYSVSTAVICYYLAPVLVTLVAGVFMKERLTPRKLICVLLSFVGAALVSGVGTGMEGGQLQCVLFASIAAIFYASVTLTTKTMRDIPAKDCTVVQLLTAAAFLLPYTLIFERDVPRSFDTVTVLFLLIVGVLHTGVAFGLYFYAVGRLPAFTVSLYSYLDPVVAIVLSALIFREKLGWLGVIGAVLVIGAAVLGEIQAKQNDAKREGD